MNGSQIIDIIYDAYQSIFYNMQHFLSYLNNLKLLITKNTYNCILSKKKNKNEKVPFFLLKITQELNYFDHHCFVDIISFALLKEISQLRLHAFP